MAIKLWNRGLRRDFKPDCKVASFQMKNVPAETSVAVVFDGFSVGQGERDLAGWMGLDAIALFMHQSMMPAAQQHQVVHGSFTAIRPVVDVMGIDEPGAVTAREAAAAIPLV